MLSQNNEHFILKNNKKKDYYGPANCTFVTPTERWIGLHFDTMPQSFYSARNGANAVRFRPNTIWSWVIHSLLLTFTYSGIEREDEARETGSKNARCGCRTVRRFAS